MKLPNSEYAIIDPGKLRDYLLSPSHPIGRFKAGFFSSLGYTQENWRQLEADLRGQHFTKDVSSARKLNMARNTRFMAR